MRIARERYNKIKAFSKTYIFIQFYGKNTKGKKSKLLIVFIALGTLKHKNKT